MSLKVNGFGHQNADVEARLVDLLEGCRSRGTQGLRISYGKSRFMKMKELQTDLYADTSNAVGADRTTIISVDHDDSLMAKVTGEQEEPHRAADFWKALSGFRDPRHYEPRKRCLARRYDEILLDAPDEWNAITQEPPP